MTAHTLLPPSPVVATVDFAQDGAQHGFLRLPHSRDDSAWGSVLIPISVIRRGTGPTALLTGANHGDEYEGPVALFELARTLDPATLTEKIADYFQRHLLPLADIVLDIHSGGKTLEFLPFAASHVLPDKAQEARCAAAAEAFGAPYAMRMLEIDAAGMYDTAAEGLGKTFVTTELGGGGTTTARTVEITRRGVRNLLIHGGILEGTVERRPTRRLDMPSSACFLFSEAAGLVEPCLDLGEPVTAGQVVARIHPVDRTGIAPIPCTAAIDGLLAARHFPGLIQSGDCVAVIGVEIR